MSGKFVSKIDLEAIVNEIVNHCDVKSKFNELLDNSELKIDESVASDMLLNIVKLYARVRSQHEIANLRIRLDALKNA